MRKYKLKPLKHPDDDYRITARQAAFILGVSIHTLRKKVTLATTIKKTSLITPVTGDKPMRLWEKLFSLEETKTKAMESLLEQYPDLHIMNVEAILTHRVEQVFSYGYCPPNPLPKKMVTRDLYEPEPPSSEHPLGVGWAGRDVEKEYADELWKVIADISRYSIEDRQGALNSVTVNWMGDALDYLLDAMPHPLPPGHRDIPYLGDYFPAKKGRNLTERLKRHYNFKRSTTSCLQVWESMKYLCFLWLTFNNYVKDFRPKGPLGGNPYSSCFVRIAESAKKVLHGTIKVIPYHDTHANNAFITGENRKWRPTDVPRFELVWLKEFNEKFIYNPISGKVMHKGRYNVLRNPLLENDVNTIAKFSLKHHPYEPARRHRIQGSALVWALSNGGIPYEIPLKNKKSNTKTGNTRTSHTTTPRASNYLKGTLYPRPLAISSLVNSPDYITGEEKHTYIPPYFPERIVESWKSKSGGRYPQCPVILCPNVWLQSSDINNKLLREVNPQAIEDFIWGFKPKAVFNMKELREEFPKVFYCPEVFLNVPLQEPNLEGRKESDYMGIFLALVTSYHGLDQKSYMNNYMESSLFKFYGHHLHPAKQPNKEEIIARGILEPEANLIFNN